MYQEHFDPHKTQPSPVLHVRGLGDAAIEADLVETVQHFGSVKDIIMIPHKKQALIEFDVCYFYLLNITAVNCQMTIYSVFIAEIYALKLLCISHCEVQDNDVE